MVEKVAAIHGGRFGAVDPPAGFSTCYRISLAPRAGLGSVEA